MRRIKEFLDLKDVIKKFQEMVVEPSPDKPIEPNWDNLRSSEALFGFAGWLTTMDKPVIASSRHDAAIWAQLVGEFCDTNGLEDPRNDWPDYFVMPPADFIKESKLMEIMDDPAPFKITTNTPGIVEAEFVIKDKEYSFMAWYNFDVRHPVTGENSQSWDIDFVLDVRDTYDGVHPSIKITGTGDQFPIFATVAAIIRELIRLKNPSMISFSAKEDSRVRLYKIFAGKLAGEMGGDFSTEPMGGGRGTRFYVYK